MVLAVTNQRQRQSRPRVIPVVDPNFLRSLIMGSMSLLRSKRSCAIWASPPPRHVAPRCGTRRPSPWPTGLTPAPVPEFVFDQRLSW